MVGVAIRMVMMVMIVMIVMMMMMSRRRMIITTVVFGEGDLMGKWSPALSPSRAETMIIRTYEYKNMLKTRGTSKNGNHKVPKPPSTPPC